MRTLKVSLQKQRREGKEGREKKEGSSKTHSKCQICQTWAP